MDRAKGDNAVCGTALVPTAAHAPVSLGSSPVTWLMQAWSNKQADSNNRVATHRFLKGRRIPNGHASLENFPYIGGRWKGLSIQIWHVLPTLLAAYQFTSATFLFHLFFFVSVPTFPCEQNFFWGGSSYNLSRRYNFCMSHTLFGLCLTSTLLGIYFPSIRAPNTKPKWDYFSVYITRTSLEKEEPCNYSNGWAVDDLYQKVSTIQSCISDKPLTAT